MDITDTLAPKSDQLDAVDLVGGPRTFTITGVRAGSSAEQPVEVRLAEFPRVWRPGKSMRRVLAAAWTPHASEWTGRRVTLFCDLGVRFGGVEVGGIRISHMSHIDGPKKVPLLISKGKSAVFVVEPLKDAPAPTAPRPDPTSDWTEPKQLAAGRDSSLRVVADADLPPLPGDDDSFSEFRAKPEPVEVEQPTLLEAVPEPVADRRPGGITDPQSKMMFALLKDAGLTEREDRLDYCRTVIGRQVESSAELTKGEAQRIVDSLVALTTAADDPEPGFDDEPHPDEFLVNPE